LLGWLFYASSKNDLVRLLQQIGFPDERLATSIARFSFGEMGLFILFLVLSVSLLTLIASGAFSGRRARWAGVSLGLLMVIDLARADVPWIVYVNYQQKYASNPVIEFLRQQRHTWRSTAEIAPLSRQWLINDQGKTFARVYFDWLQHQFQYYRIQSLDIIQMPRLPEADKAYLMAFRSGDEAGWAWCGRLWQLTNTRYVIGMTGFLDLLNAKFDPVQHRFRVHTTFDLAPKPGFTEVSSTDQLTAVLSTNGQFALFEFTGALPRAKLFAHWQVHSNDHATLEQLKSPVLDPAQTVLVADALPSPNPAISTNQAGGAVGFAHYERKRVQLETTVTVPSVLLLNDHFDPDWKVLVDGKPEPMLRCNYIMRGVYLTPGQHRVEFRFQPPLTAFYISLTGFITGVFLCGYVLVTKNSPKSTEIPGPSDARQSKISDRSSR
jgi:hypothetical protein